MEFKTREDEKTISIWLNAMLRTDNHSRCDMQDIYERIYNGECIFKIRDDYKESEGSGIITYFGRKANRMQEMPTPDEYWKYFIQELKKVIEANKIRRQKKPKLKITEPEIHYYPKRG
jgi:hypothetical protein